MAKPYPGVFLDRDGTINMPPPPGGYVLRWEDFRFIPGVIEALARLRADGSRLALATNQRCVARGLCAHADVESIHERMQRQLTAHEAQLDLVQFCPHAEDDHPDRKPNPGMIERGIRFLELDRRRCVMIGDDARDIQAGQAADIATVLVTGQCHAGALPAAMAAGADFVCEDLPSAVDWIAARTGAG